MTNRRGSEPLTLLIVLAVLGSTQLVPNWRLSRLFKSEPKVPLSELQAARDSLAKLKQESDQAILLLQQKKQEEQVLFKTQVQTAQQLNEGVILSLNRLPSEKHTKETRLASSLASRVSLRLLSAIGSLPKDQQTEILYIVDLALSESQQQIAEAEKRLQEKDAEAKVLQQEKLDLQNQLPVLQAKVDMVLKEKQEVEKIVSQKTDEVIVVTRSLQAEKQSSGSLSSSLDKLFFQLKVVFASLLFAYIFLVWILPGLIKHLSTGPLKSLLRNISGYLTSPLLYHDAKAKLTKVSK